MQLNCVKKNRQIFVLAIIIAHYCAKKSEYRKNIKKKQESENYFGDKN